MSSVSPSSNDVLRGFISAANKQYRDAGLGQYQMRVHKDGTVTVPHASAGFKAPAASGSAAPEQAQAGAAPAAPAAGAQGAAAPDPTKAKRTGQPPKVTDLQQSGSEAFKIAWGRFPVPSSTASGRTAPSSATSPIPASRPSSRPARAA
jgi:hypothetical protein